MAISLGSVVGNAWTKIAQMSTTLLVGLAVLIALGIAGWWLFRKWQNLTFFKHPITLTVLMENGIEKTRYDLKGGVFWNGGVRDFKIKIPKTRKPHILGYVPDFSKSSSVDGRIHFITSGDRTIWQQVESQWITREKREDDKGNVFQYNLLNKPVPSDTKKLTINSIRSWRETIDKNKLTTYSIAIGAFIIMVIAHLGSLFIQTKIRCGTG